MLTRESVTLMALWFFGSGVLWVLFDRGVFSSRAFDRAPGRQGPMTLADALVGVGMFIISSVVVVSALRWAGMAPEAGEAMTARQLLVTMFVMQAAFIPVAIFTFARLTQSRPDPPKLGPLRSTAIGVMGVVVVAPILLLVMHIVTRISTAAGHPPPEIGHIVLTQLMDPDLSPWVRWGLILSAVIGAPLFEETIFRGLLQSSMLQSGVVRSRWTAIVIASVLFATIHLDAAAPHALIMLYLLSLALGYVYERTGSLLAPITMHATFNALQILAVSLMEPAQQL